MRILALDSSGLVAGVAVLESENEIRCRAGKIQRLYWRRLRPREAE